MNLSIHFGCYVISKISTNAYYPKFIVLTFSIIIDFTLGLKKTSKSKKVHWIKSTRNSHSKYHDKNDR